MSEPRAPSRVTTGPAAAAIGVHPVTLWRWYRKGRVTPAWVTAGGQARWDVEDLRRQIRELHPAAEPPDDVEEEEIDLPPLIPLLTPVIIPEFSHTA